MWYFAKARFITIVYYKRKHHSFGRKNYTTCSGICSIIYIVCIYMTGFSSVVPLKSKETTRIIVENELCMAILNQKLIK